MTNDELMRSLRQYIFDEALEVTNQDILAAVEALGSACNRMYAENKRLTGSVKRLEEENARLERDIQRR